MYGFAGNGRGAGLKAKHVDKRQKCNIIPSTIEELVDKCEIAVSAFLALFLIVVIALGCSAA
jgi:hypothetical protein